VDDFEELRHLLLGPEQDQLRALRDHLEDKEKRAREVSGVLPQAAKLSAERGAELSRALQPVVADSVRDSIKTRPQVFIEAFHPIIGSLVRRSITESLRGLMQALNQALEHTFSWQGLKWRFEAWRTGRSFAEVLMLRSLVYRVEQIFLIHRATSLLLLHVASDESSGKDSDMIAGMLSAIQEFSRDAFHAGADAILEEFRVGELEIWISLGRDAYLAAVIRGNPPRELRTTLDEAIENMHILKGSAFAKFDGDASEFESLRPELEGCLQMQYKGNKAGELRLTKAWLTLAGAAALALAVTFLFVRSQRHWDDFIHRLNIEPGIAVTSAHKGWLSASRVTGFRDPLAADVAPLTRQMGMDAARIEFEWKDYLALDSISVRRRVESRFGVPAGVRVAVAQGILEISGAVPYEWLERVRKEGKLVPGVNSLAERALTVTYDPALALERFRAAFAPPPDITAHIEDGTLHLSGKAAYEWIAPVREGATHLPGINALADQEVQVAFDPALVLQRFEGRFGLPVAVNAVVQDGVLSLSGEASHPWLVRVRAGATELPGITSIEARNLIDLDQTTFQQSKSVIESAFVYFLLGKENFATEGFAALSRLPDEIRRCQSSAKRIGTEISVEIRGSADAVGTEAKNQMLSEHRANAVRDFLVSCGLDASMLKPVGAPTPSAAAAGAKPLPEESARRVGFHVNYRP